jgi:hypothetical protein
VVVSNNGDAGALLEAREAGAQAVHLSSRTHGDQAEDAIVVIFSRDRQDPFR